jgi:hypothetical protein
MWGLFHFTGSLWGVLLSLLIARKTGVDVSAVNGYFMRLSQPVDHLPQSIPRSEVRGVILRHRRKLRYRIQEGGWAWRIPASWRDTHLLASVDVDGFMETLQGLSVNEDIPPEQKEMLVELAGAMF